MFGSSESGSRSRAAVTILVVDDEPSLRNMVARALEYGGFATLQANDGDEALTLLRAAKPEVHLVLTDLRMPGTDGLALGKAVRQEFPDLGVVYMSAYGNPGLPAGATGEPPIFVGKPFTASAIVAAVEEALVRRQAARSGAYRIGR